MIRTFACFLGLLGILLFWGCQKNAADNDCSVHKWGSIHFVNSTQNDYDIFVDLKNIGEIKPNGSFDSNNDSIGKHGWEVQPHNHISSNPPDYGSVEVSQCTSTKVTIIR